MTTDVITTSIDEQPHELDPNKPLVQVKDLEVSFRTQGGDVHAVRGVNFDIYPGETVAIVGESGSGKSTTATALMNLLPGNGRISGGQVLIEDKDISKLGQRQMAAVRGHVIGYVPQDPMSNLNPVWSVGFQVREAIKANGLAKGRKEVEARAIEVLQQAGLSDAERRMKQFPHQFSGGMRQRVLIGIGLGANPKLLIADEPTSALDVTVQKTILDHIENLTRARNTAVLLITHDLGLAAERASKVIVMHQGKIVEAGPSRAILTDPQHPYTRRLLAAAPSIASQRIGATVSEDAKDEGVIELASIAKDRHEEAEAHAGGAVVKVEDLTKVFSIRRGGFKSEDLTAVDNVSFEVHKGTTMALVGESGSGKTTVARMILGLETPTSGEITVGGTRLDKAQGKELFDVRRRMQPVFQDPYASLDPQRSIGAIIGEPLKVHKVGDAKSRTARVEELLDQVSLPGAIAHRYPNELSGGQRQRVAIARALALKPEVVVLDEAVSALDVLVQAQVLQLLADLQTELGLTYLFITHDLAVVRVIADEVAVMEQGKIVEAGATDEVFANPQQAYTQRLLDAIPGSGLDWAV
ncbi:ABC transporter ATP-binding protein [Demequina activiva]|uniref:ABC transporter ATP-binding protein n=1 Tax=Demequina activiva TaxID=1582364 RepID=A0A919Q3F2_9MICO|nr:ABC transporter ATP-binding protein [Demequina activiva]GIG53598.1 ABC transporter ATP-binding protein [Demequina activiva]